MAILPSQPCPVDCPFSEQEALLQQGLGQTTKPCSTPLPLFQLIILLYLRFCEASAFYVIEPFIKELLSSFAGGDEATTTYLASVMDICLYTATLSTVLHLNRLSDSIGRKPIIVLGIAAVATSALLVGLSTTFWAFVVNRCIHMALNQGGIVARCAVSEMTDESNSADAFSYLNVPWALGMLTGPLIGGYLSNPSSRMPELFSGRLWERLPYLLPCATVAFVTAPGLLTVCIWFRETLPRRPSYVTPRDSETPESAEPSEQTPIRSLLIPRVILVMANDIGLAFLNSAYAALYPLFLGMPPSVGGLGLPPSQIGLVLAARGLFRSPAQALLIGPAVRNFTLGRVFTTAIASYIPTFLLLMNLYATDSLMNSNSISRSIMWSLLVLQLLFVTTVESGYTCMYMYIIAAAPSRRTLGAVNGLTQISVTGARLSGSALTTFMLGVSIKRGWLGGYAVYVLMTMIGYACVFLARRLPRTVAEWSDREG